MTDQSKGKVITFSAASVGTAAIAGPALGAIVSGRLGLDSLFSLITCLMFMFPLLAIM
ncbi:hypothetical protein [Halalkalibacter lacteus]|uniref:hypothetical protein n=1 Tax=Halalkalibacter lacteus TaxID=3090663 RepID=UPI002FCC329B